MTDPRDALLAALDREEALADAAQAVDPGPWSQRDDDAVRDLNGAGVLDGDAASSDTLAFIAANSPEKVKARLAAARAIVAEHRPTHDYRGVGCALCWPKDDGWPCGTVLALTDAWAPGWRTA